MLAVSPLFRNVSLERERHWRVVSARTQGPGEELTIQVARSLAIFDQESRELLFTFLLTGPLALLAAVGGGYFLAARALAPVDRITATANQITADQLSQRIAVLNPDDELGALGQTLNRMIGRLEQSFAEMQRFTADAAHELRTPLAVIRNEAEVALRVPRSPEAYCQVLENLLEEVNRLSQVAEQLLFLSRQDAGLHPCPQEDLAAEDLLRDVVGNMQLVAQEKGINLILQGNVPCRIRSNARQLRRVLYNLLDNALKYTNPPGQVTVLASNDAHHWQVTITDNGIGIPPEHLPHVFERFYRVDSARAGDGSGAGLGLAICRSIIRGLRGRIELDSQVGMGTTVRLVIPRR
jgi:heavy metal sensor kinase